VQNCFRQVDIYPELRRNQAMLQNRTSSGARRADAAEFPKRIPVAVHILFNDDADNITDEQVASQIEVLNEEFSGQNGDHGNVPQPFQQSVGVPDLEFFLAEEDPTVPPRRGSPGARRTSRSSRR
jgi:hypothetical protein